MPTFGDYDEFADDLVLPIHGKQYRIPPITARTGVLLQRAQTDPTVLDGMDTQAVLRLSLGDTYDQMLADDVPDEAVARAHLTALALHAGGIDVARATWERSNDPELAAALTAAAQQKATPPASTPSRSTAAGSKTRKPATSSGTSTRKATPRPASSRTAKPSH